LRLLLSFIATLALLGVAFSFLHWLILALGLSDLAALLLFALPVCGYIAFATQETNHARLGFATRIYLVFAAVTLSAAGLVWYID
jgi:hypothetical protein